MLGSKIIVVEYFERSVFKKFVRVFLRENGFKEVQSVFRRTDIGIDCIAIKKKSKHVVRIETKSKLREKSEIDSILKSKNHYDADALTIITKRDLTDEIKQYILDNNCAYISKPEIEAWLDVKFNSVLEFLEYLENTGIRQIKTYTASELIQKYQNLKSEIGRQPSMTDISKHMDLSHATYSHRWGTFRNFILSVGDKPNVRFSRPNKSMLASVSDMVEDYLKIRKKLERTPSNLEIETIGKYTPEYHCNFFGSVTNFVINVETEINNAQMYTKEDLINEYRSIQEIVHRVPSFTDFSKKSKISPIIYQYHWDTWNNFLKAIGEKIQYKNINDKELVLAYYDMKEKFSKNPSQVEFMKYCGVSHDVFEYRFGCWNNFLDLLEYPEFVSQTPNEVDLFTDYFRIKQILNLETLTQEEIKRHTQFTLKDYVKNFGSMKKFKEEIASIEEKSKLIEDEELVNEYLRLLAELDKTWLTIYDISKHSTYHYPVYLTKYKSWPKIVVLMRNYVGKIKHPVNVTNNQMIRDYHRVEKLLKKSPLFISDYAKYGKYCVANFEKRFGSWKQYLRSIGQKSAIEITKKEIIEDYFKVRTLLNKKVLYRRDYEKYGKYSDTAIRNRYGKWSNFLLCLGEDLSHMKRIDKETLIKDYKRVKKLLKKEKINQPDMLKHGKYGTKSFSRYFGSWDKFLEYMGEDSSKLRIPDKVLIKEYYRVKKLVKKEAVSLLDMNTHATVSSAIYRLRFGNWKDFLDKIGEDTERMRQITDDDLKAEYIRIKKELNKSKLKLDDIKKHGKYKSKAYLNHFGSWSNFVRLMGDGNAKYLNTDKEVIDEYWRLKTELGKNYISHNDMNKFGKYSSALYTWRYGSWKEFLKHIGEEPDFRKAKKMDKEKGILQS